MNHTMSAQGLLGDSTTPVVSLVDLADDLNIDSFAPFYEKPNPKPFRAKNSASEGALTLPQREPSAAPAPGERSKHAAVLK